MAFAGAAYGFVAAVASFAAALFTQYWWFLLGRVVSILLIGLSRTIKRRSTRRPSCSRSTRRSSAT